MLQFTKQGIGAREQLFTFGQIVPKLVLMIPAAHRDFYRVDQSFRPQWPLKQGRASHKWQICNFLPPTRHPGAESRTRAVEEDARTELRTRWLLFKERLQQLQSHPNQCLFGNDNGPDPHSSRAQVVGCRVISDFDAGVGQDSHDYSPSVRMRSQDEGAALLTG